MQSATAKSSADRHNHMWDTHHNLSMKIFATQRFSLKRSRNVALMLFAKRTAGIEVYGDEDTPLRAAIAA